MDDDKAGPIEPPPSYQEAISGNDGIQEPFNYQKYEEHDCGPRPDQYRAFGWFENQGWKTKWPLHYAAMKGDLLSIYRLVKRDNVPPGQKMTDWFDAEPVGWAASFGQLGALRCLIDLGAYPFTVNKSGNDALADARRERHQKCIAFLEEYKKTSDPEAAKTAADKAKATSSTEKTASPKIYVSPISVSDIKAEDYNEPGTGPRPDQLNTYGWFESQGWNGKWPLHYAAMKGDVAAIIDLVKYRNTPPDQKMTDWFDAEPVGWAASLGHLGALRCLIDLGAYPFTVNKSGNDALSDARRERHQKCIDFLEKCKEDPNIRPGNAAPSIAGTSSEAGKAAQTNISANVIKAEDYNEPGTGPRPDQLKAYGWFESKGWKSKWPVHYAAMKGDVASIIDLVKNRNIPPDQKMTDWYDSEPVGWAASLGHLGALRCLIDLGAYPFTVNKAGNDALKDARRERHQKCIDFLMECKKNPNRLTSKNATSKAGTPSKAGNVGPAKIPMNDVKAEDYNEPGTGPRRDQLKAYGWFEGKGWKGKWPLHYAAMKGDVAAIIDLVKNKNYPPDKKMTDWFDSEPVGWASSFGHLGALRCLIDLGAYPFTVNKSGNDALTDARRERHPKCITFLEEYKKNPNTRTAKSAASKAINRASDSGAAASGDYVIPDSARYIKVDDYIEPGTGPKCYQYAAFGWFERQGWKYKWPVHYAAMKGDVASIIDLVKNKNRRPDEIMTDWFDSEPVGWAASLGQLGALRCLIDLGAYPFKMNKAGFNGLTDARRERHPKCIAFLEEYQRTSDAAAAKTASDRAPPGGCCVIL